LLDYAAKLGRQLPADDPMQDDQHTSSEQHRFRRNDARQHPDLAKTAVDNGLAKLPRPAAVAACLSNSQGD
jgi:hypothetical protein